MKKVLIPMVVFVIIYGFTSISFAGGLKAFSRGFTSVYHGSDDRTNKQSDSPTSNEEAVGKTRNGSDDTTVYQPSTQSANKLTITAQEVVVRSGPSDEYERMGSVFKDEVYNMLNRSSEWVKIRLDDGSIGWVPSASVSLTSSEYTQNQSQYGKPLERRTYALSSEEQGELDEELIDAVKDGNIDDVVALLDRGADVNARKSGAFRESMTPLMYAADRRHMAVARLLLDRGADVNARSKYGKTALIYATIWNRSDVDLIQLLVDRGADVRVRTNDLGPVNQIV